MMIASVVVAVGMTEIVGGWGRMVRSPARISYDWLHFGWTLYVLLFAIQYWIGMWSYHSLEISYVGQVYFLVIPTIFVVLAAYAITPDVPLEGEFDVRRYYMQKRVGVFLPLAAFSLTAWLADLVIAGIDSVEISFMVLAVLGAISMGILVVTERLWVHWLILIIGLVLVFGNFLTPMSFQDERWLAS